MKISANLRKNFALCIIVWCAIFTVINFTSFTTVKGDGGDNKVEMEDEVVANITAERIDGEVVWTFQLNSQYYSNSCAMGMSLMEALREDCGENLK